MSRYLSINAISQSLPHLEGLNPFFGMSFLAFKHAQIPVGEVRAVNFSRLAQTILEKHYKPALAYAGFYNPFRTSDPSNRWVKPRYGSTSLQRITTDTFADALIHTKKEQIWGWKTEYVSYLSRHLGSQRVPAFHLGVWLFRDEAWPADASTSHVVDRLVRYFELTKPELDGLFDTSAPAEDADWFSTMPVAETELLALLGNPPDWDLPADSALRTLRIRDVGPAALLEYEPAGRLNLITGNNSLGKTFLLECLWWALTGDWLDYAALPRRDVAKSRPSITFSLASATGKGQEYKGTYNWDRGTWNLSSASRRMPGLVIYARHDGSFAIWDPARARLSAERSDVAGSGKIFLRRDHVWNGTQENSRDGKERWVCNGL